MVDNAPLSCVVDHDNLFNQILAFMLCNTVWLRYSIRFSHSCSATEFVYALQPDSRIHTLQHSLVTHFNHILAFMPCNAQFGYALQSDSRIHALQHRVWLRTSTRLSHSCPATQFGYAFQSDSRIHALQQCLITHFNQILAFMLCSTAWLRTSTRFLHLCPATHSLATHFNQILAFMPCNTQFGYALQPDSRIHALQHRAWLTHFNQILEFMPCNTQFGYEI